MAKFKVNLADPATGKVQAMELDGPKAQPLVGRQLGELVDGAILSAPAQKVKITGGSDKDGIPLSPNVHGGAKKYVMLSEGVGFNPKHEGERRRKLVRGKMVSEETYQVNAVIVKGEGEKVASPAEAPNPPKVKKQGQKRAKAEGQK